MTNQRTTVLLRVVFAVSALTALVTTTLVDTPEGHTAAVGPAGGAAFVSVDPNEWLTDGQTVQVHADASAGYEIFEIRARVCAPDAGVNNSFEFSLDGSFCAAVPMSADADADVGVVLDPGSRASGDLSFRVSAGSATWTTHSPVDPPGGAAWTLNCGPGAPCALVVQLEISGGQAYFTAPLLFGEGTTPPPAPPAAPEIATPGAAAAGAAATTGDPTASAATGGDAAKQGKRAADAGKAGAGKDGDAANGASTTDASATQEESGLRRDLGSSTLAVSREAATRGVRVFSGMVAGLVGGLLIAMIVIRARARTVSVRNTG
jgi:hypothetical protein